MSQLLIKSQDIRYTKLTFIIEFTEDTVLPKQKVSAIRGGIGEMLLRANCVRRRECEGCDFADECIVQRIMYSKYEKKPSFVTTGESVGYVLECDNYKEEFYQGDQLSFHLILFGKNIVYFNQYLQAVNMLGVSGLGKHQAHFVIAAVKNQYWQDILVNNSINMGNYQISTVGEYIDYRMRQLQKARLQEPQLQEQPQKEQPQKEQLQKEQPQKEQPQKESSQKESQGNLSHAGDGCYSGMLAFRTPFTVKYQGEFIRDLQMEPIIASIRRRLYMLDCFEGIEAEIFWDETPETAITVRQQSRLEGVNRYSNRRDSAMTLRGIKGKVWFEGADLDTMKLLFAGELLHVGKNSSFGFGEYQVMW